MEWKTAALFPNPEKDPEGRAARAAAAYFAGRGVRVTASEECARPAVPGVEYLPAGRVYSEAQLLVALGGDGTMLRAAKVAAPLGLPMLGINLGTVGFLAEVELSGLSLLDRLFTGEYFPEERMMLTVERFRGDEVLDRLEALNDAVVSNGASTRTVDLHLFCDGVKVSAYRADGLIVCTPTGSTAYSLSAGGPVIDAGVESCMCATPVCSHSLLTRPAIFSGKSTLEIAFERRRGGPPVLTVDGGEGLPLGDGESVRVKKSPRAARFLRFSRSGFYDIIQKKISDSFR